MSVILAIDTAAPRLQLALSRADGTADSLIEDMAQGQAERLLPAIGELLARSGLAYADLTRVAVTTGPGSFTGLRIGLSAARGLGLALGVPVIGVPSLLAISLDGPAGQGFVVALDARRGEAYRQSFSAPGVPDGPVELAQADGPVEGAMLSGRFAPIGLLASFAADADPTAFPPEASYVRDADAKPQEKFRVARA